VRGRETERQRDRKIERHATNATADSKGAITESQRVLFVASLYIHIYVHTHTHTRTHATNAKAVGGSAKALFQR